MIRLSTTYDCWKNSCQEATVVPTIPMNHGGQLPGPARHGRDHEVAGHQPGGPVGHQLQGINSSDPVQNATAIRSTARKLPLNAAAMTTKAVSATAAIFGTPR